MNNPLDLIPRPSPGSTEAAKKGCTCARIDNHYGKGRYGDGDKSGWFVTEGCPLHWPVNK